MRRKYRRMKVKDDIILNPGVRWKYVRFSGEISRETSWETSWNKETRPREGGFIIHKGEIRRNLWNKLDNKGNKASGRRLSNQGK